MIMGIRQLAIRKMNEGYEFPQMMDLEDGDVEEVDIRRL